MEIDYQYFPNISCMVNSDLCRFDSDLTLAGLITTLSALLLVVLAYWLLKQKTNKPLKQMLIMGAGILLFELFTAPMWNTEHLGRWSYIYNDFSMTFTVGWVGLFLLSIAFVDKVFNKIGEIGRFFLYLLPISVTSIVSENLLVWGGVRSYAPEIWQTSIGKLGLVPVEGLYYAPVFSALVLSFYLAWTKAAKADLRKAFTLKRIGLTALILTAGITMYELLIEPVVTAPGFPEWSYIYQDISLLRIGLWVLMLFAGMFIGNLFVRGLKKVSQMQVFWAYVLASSAVFYLVEMVLLTSRSRVYTESVTGNFTGLMAPIVNLPLEILIAIVIYNALIVSFLKYWLAILSKR